MSASQIKAAGAFVTLSLKSTLKAALNAAAANYGAFVARMKTLSSAIGRHALLPALDAGGQFARKIASLSKGLVPKVLDAGGKFARQLNSYIGKVGSYVKRMTSFGRELAAVSLVPAIGFVASVRNFTSYSDALLRLKANATEGRISFEELAASLAKVGKGGKGQPAFKATEVVNAATELAKAGFSREDIASSVQPVLNLSRAVGVDLAHAAEIVSDTLQGFGLSLTEGARAADVLALAANKSTASVDDIFESLKYIAPVAREMGLSFEDAAAASAVLANVGIKGEQAGTAVRRAGIQFAKADIQAKLLELGVSAVNAAGDLKPATQLLAELFDAVSSAPSAERLRTLYEILDARGLLAVQLGRNKEAFTEMISAILRGDVTVQQLAETMDSEVGGALRRAAVAVDDMIRAVGEAIAGPLEEFARWVVTAARSLGEWIQANQEFVVNLAKGTAAVLAFGVGLAALGPVATIVSVGLGAIQVAVGAVITIAGLAVTAFASLATAMAQIPVVGGLVAVLFAATIPAAIAATIQAITGTLLAAISRAGDAISGFAGKAGEEFRLLSAAFRSGDMETAIELIGVKVELVFAQIEAAINRALDALRVFKQTRLSSAANREKITGADTPDEAVAKAKQTVDQIQAEIERVNAGAKGTFLRGLVPHQLPGELRKWGWRWLKRGDLHRELERAQRDLEKLQGLSDQARDRGTDAATEALRARIEELKKREQAIKDGAESGFVIGFFKRAGEAAVESAGSLAETVGDGIAKGVDSAKPALSGLFGLLSEETQAAITGALDRIRNAGKPAAPKDLAGRSEGPAFAKDLIARVGDRLNAAASENLPSRGVFATADAHRLLAAPGRPIEARLDKLNRTMAEVKAATEESAEGIRKLRDDMRNSGLKFK